MSAHTAPFTKRFRQRASARGYYMTLDQAAAIQRAFVEALKEEMELRFVLGDGPNSRLPLTIAGLGSFRMVERPTRTFADPAGPKDAVVVKAPARKLAFRGKWEPIK